MACKRYEKWLTDAALEAFDVERQRELEAHLLACGACRHELEREQSLLASIDSVLAESLDAQLPSGFAARVRVCLAEERPASWLPAHAWIPVTVGALALVLLLVWFAPDRARSPKPGNRLPEVAVSGGQKTGVRSSEVRRLHAGMRRAHRGRRRGAVPHVMVDKNQWAAVVQLYNAIWSGRVDSASLLAKPDDDASAALKPMEIKPLEVPKLDAELRPLGQESGQ